jgi:hypothetical protein
VRHQSQRGGLPGMEEVVFRQMRTRTRLPHRSTDLYWAAIVRANVPGSESDSRGAHFVWGGPCVGRFSHTKWATQIRPLPGLQLDLAIFPLTSTSFFFARPSGRSPMPPIPFGLTPRRRRCGLSRACLPPPARARANWRTPCRAARACFPLRAAASGAASRAPSAGTRVRSN